MRHLLQTTSIVLTLLLLTSSVSADVGDNSVGMNTHQPNQAMIDACVELGVKWIRVDANWYQLEPSDDNYNFGFMDAIVDRANAGNLKVYMTLAYTPAWVPRHGDTDGQFHNDTPNTSDEWVDFIRDIVPHYRSKGVTHFGLWNEPNLDNFFEGSLQEYVDLIALPGAQAIRDVCQDCKVLGPDLAPIRDPDQALIYILERTIDTWDILTHHIYKGFHETDVDPWEDSFINQLESGMWLWSTRGLQQIFDRVGWSGEVWITETGHHCEPAEDPNEEALQATYSRLVLEAQLERPWYTNTFFYEILDCKPDQPDCPIDGFGIIRAQPGDPGSRTFPANFRMKPAFHEIQSFIQSHPEIISEGGPATQCSDGVDNDLDGQIDLQDRGCDSAQDDDESDDPQRPQIVALNLPNFTVDGDLNELAIDEWVSLGPDAWRGSGVIAPGDVSARMAARWSSLGLVVALEVTDDAHDNAHSAEELWMGDSVQLAFDVSQSGGVGYDALDDHEFSIGLSDGQVMTTRHHGPAGADDEITAAIIRGGVITTYEMLLPSSTLPSVSFNADVTIGFSFLVNDADNEGREGWIEWTPGIGSGKNPEMFGEILLKIEDVEQPDIDAAVLPDIGAPDQDASIIDERDASSSDLGQADVYIDIDDVSALDSTESSIDSAPSGPDDQGISIPQDMTVTKIDLGSAPSSSVADEGCGCDVAKSNGSSLLIFWILAGVALLFRYRRSFLG